jgi:hypothetical protein
MRVRQLSRSTVEMFSQERRCSAPVNHLPPAVDKDCEPVSNTITGGKLGFSISTVIEISLAVSSSAKSLRFRAFSRNRETLNNDPKLPA